MIPHNPVVLTQQILAWLLQAMGLIAEDRQGSRALRHVKASTLKTAITGAPVPEKWGAVIDEVFAAFDVSLTDEQRRSMAAAAHDWDQRVSRLNSFGLDTAEALPAVLRVVVPEIGARFGALAALVGGLDATGLAVRDWLCDPLNPRVFARAVEWLFERYRPDLKSWTSRYEALHSVGVHRRSVEAWRFDHVKTPNAANLVAIASLMKEGQRNAIALLRLARLLTVLRQAVSARVGGETAEQYQRGVAAFAFATRDALGAPGVIADIADFLALALESENGEGAHAKLLAFFGQPSPTLAAHDAAIRLRAASGRVRAGGSNEELAWITWVQVLDPVAPLLGAIGIHLGNPDAFTQTVTDPLTRVQAEWQRQAFLLHLASGEPVTWARPGAEAVTRVPGAAIRLRADRLAAAGRKLYRQPDEKPPDDMDFVLVLIELGELLGGGDGVAMMIGLLNAASPLAAVPAELESVASDAAVLELPHLMAERARRLADEGQDAEALDWIRRWRANSVIHSVAERRAAAQAAVTVAHRQIDGRADARGLLRRDLPCPVEQMPAALREQLLQAVDALQAQLALTLRIADQLLQIAIDLLRLGTGNPADVDDLVLLLPLAIRLDFLAADATDEADDTDLPRSEPIAAALQAVGRGLPHHGPAWAVLALWRHVTDEEPAFALRQADHYGSRSVYEAETARLVRDGRLTQDTGRP